MVASYGGIFAFDARSGSIGGTGLNKPVAGMVRYGDGYLMVGADGGIFNFSTSPFAGSLGDNAPANPVVADRDREGVGVATSASRATRPGGRPTLRLDP